MIVIGVVNMLELVLDLILVSGTMLIIIGNEFHLSYFRSSLFINMKEVGQGDVCKGNDLQDGSRVISEISFA